MALDTDYLDRERERSCCSTGWSAPSTEREGEMDTPPPPPPRETTACFPLEAVDAQAYALQSPRARQREARAAKLTGLPMATPTPAVEAAVPALLDLSQYFESSGDHFYGKRVCVLC